MAPGVFGRDDNDAKHSGKPFFYLDANRVGASDDDIEKTILRHIDTKAEVDLDDHTGHRYTAVVGWDHFFTATAPNTQGYKVLENSGDKGKCLQLRDQHQTEGVSCGLYIGGKTGHQEDLCYWTHSVIGIQFQWTSRHSTHKNNGGLQLYDLWLTYMDTDYGILQYAPICLAKQWQGEVTTIGDDPAEKYWSGTEPGTPIEEVDGKSLPDSRSVPQLDTRGAIDNAQKHNGRVIAYLSDEHVEKVRNNRMMCVGLYLATVPGNQGTVYDRFWDIFSVKLLVHKPSEEDGSSVKVLGPPISLRDATIQNHFMIAPNSSV